MSESIWNDPRITAYVLDELSGEALSEFERDLKQNAELAAAVEEARELTGQLEQFYAAETTPPLENHRRESILGGGTASVSPATANRRSWLRRHWVACSVAASLLIVVAGLSVPAVRMARQQTALDPHAAEPSDSATRRQAIRRPAPGEDNAEALNAEMAESAAASRQATPPEPSRSAPPSPPADANMFADSRGPQSPAASRGEARSVTGERLERLNAEKSESPDTFEFREQVAPARQLREQNLPADQPSTGPQLESLELAAPEIRQSVTQNEAPQPQSRALRRRDQAEKAEAMMEEMMLGEEERMMGMDMEMGMGMRGHGGMPAPGAEGKPATVSPDLRIPTGSVPDYGLPIDEGRGPGIAGDRFEPITDNPFRRVSEHPLSTFSIDVDTASYSKVRDFLMRAGQLPRPDAVRIEELVNYFDYDYPAPPADAEHPFNSHVEITSCPWNEKHRLARIALKGKELSREERPRCNLVFLIDTSGSMNAPNKLPLVKEGMKMLIEQLNGNDHVAIAVYAGSAGLVLDSTPAGNQGKIRRALTRLSSGGSTNGGAGIALAYQTAREHFIEGGVNRVILCTDGDFNVGTTGTDELVRMVEREAKGGVFLSVLGFGMGNHNDAMLEKISGRGNGNYAFIDNENEAYKVLVEQTAGTLVTIAKDVKLQVDFNPAHVSSYRLIGYENRMLDKEDFNDDQKDAGEIGAGHSVTALYELVPAGTEPDAARPPVTPSKYVRGPEPTAAADSDEVLTLNLRYKEPDGDTSQLVTFPVTDDGRSFDQADSDVRFAAAVAGFGMQLRRSDYAGNWTLADVQRVAENAVGEDRFGLRAEFVEMLKKARQLIGGE